MRAYGCVGVWVSFFCSYLFASALRACLPALGARPPLNQHAAQNHLQWSQHPPHDRIPSQPYRHFLVSKVSKLEDLEWPAPDKLKVESVPVWCLSDWNSCGRSLRHRQVHEHQVRMGRTWTPSEMIPHFGGDFLARQGAGVCSVSLGACVASFDSTTDTGHALPDICFMVSPSCIIVMVICSVLTHRLCLWLVSILRFFFPVVCVSSIERLLGLVIVLTSGTCGTAVLTTPLKVVEARVP